MILVDDRLPLVCWLYPFIQRNVMIKVLIGSLLVATAALGQTTPQTPKGSAAKTTSASATTGSKINSPTTASATTASKSTRPMAASATKPLPQTTREQKLQSGNSNIPTYRMKKDAGVRKVRNRYPAKDAKKNQ